MEMHRDVIIHIYFEVCRLFWREAMLVSKFDVPFHHGQCPFEALIRFRHALCVLILRSTQVHPSTPLSALAQKYLGSAKKVSVAAIEHRVAVDQGLDFLESPQLVLASIEQLSQNRWVESTLCAFGSDIELLLVLLCWHGSWDSWDTMLV